MTPGGFIIIALFLALSLWIFSGAIRRLRYQRPGLRWWVVFSLLVTSGIALGIWSAFYAEYAASSQLRVVSFPIPVAFFHLENEAWVDFPVPTVQAWASALTNVIAVTAFAILPIWIALWRRGGRRTAAREA